MTRSEAIQKFLLANTHEELAKLYSLDMECQVKVSQDSGELVKGEYNNRKWFGYKDQVTGELWKDFRIPYNAKTDPTYDDVEMSFDLAAHVEGIGLTGWDWRQRLSKYVAFDFDAIAQHSERHMKKLTDQELKSIEEAVADIPWVTLRRSTGGKGLHLYVYVAPTHTANHDEHAALARCILGEVSKLANADLRSKVDACGHVMWIWHRKMRGTDGLKIVKQGTILQDIPANWKEHIKVITGKSLKAMPAFVRSSVQTSDPEDTFEQVSGQRSIIALDSEHRRFLQWLEENNAVAQWNSDYHMLITHTIYLKEAHEQLQMRGSFETLATGKDKGADLNCFMFPMKRGAWSVRRYSPGTAESPTWQQDKQGWTKCYFNRDADLFTACRTHEGKEHPKGGYIFNTAEQAQKAANMLGADLAIPPWLTMRATKLVTHKDGRLIAAIESADVDQPDKMSDWIKEGKFWTKIFSIRGSSIQETETENFDDTVRHLVTEDAKDYGWAIFSNHWRLEPLVHVRPALQAMGLKPTEINATIGTLIMRPWTLVNKPFQPEWPGDRQWNRDAAKLKFDPSNAENPIHRHWDLILNHCGKDLDSVIINHPWAKMNGITTGAEYLKLWIASMFQKPLEPLPYLFFYGPQNSGKSMFHEALSRLMLRGYKRADVALSSSSNFNGELACAVLCVVEEINLQKSVTAYNKIKDWVTSTLLPIHKKGETPYTIPNSTHWVQCANKQEYCPAFPGDTRITMIYVPPLEREIPKRDLLVLLDKEAPDFLQSVLTVEIPYAQDRLNIPIIVTAAKKQSELDNSSLIETFISEECFIVDGECVAFSEFYDKFREWLEQVAPTEVAFWTQRRTALDVPKTFPKGKPTGQVNSFIGNLSFQDVKQTKPRLILVNDKYLKHENHR